MHRCICIEHSPLCFSYAFMYSEVMNWLMSAVLPTPLEPNSATVCEVISSQEWFCCWPLLLTTGGVHSLESSSRARLLLRDRRFLNESPLFTMPVTADKTFVYICLPRTVPLTTSPRVRTKDEKTLALRLLKGYTRFETFFFIKLFIISEWPWNRVAKIALKTMCAHFKIETFKNCPWLWTIRPWSRLGIYCQVNF